MPPAAYVVQRDAEEDILPRLNHCCREDSVGIALWRLFSCWFRFLRTHAWSGIHQPSNRASRDDLIEDSQARISSPGIEDSNDDWNSTVIYETQPKPFVNLVR